MFSKQMGNGGAVMGALSSFSVSFVPNPEATPYVGCGCCWRPPFSRYSGFTLFYKSNWTFTTKSYDIDEIIIYSGRCPFVKKVSTKRSVGGSADGRE